MGKKPSANVTLFPLDEVISMIFDDGNDDLKDRFESEVYASHEEYFRDQLLMARMMSTRGGLDADTLSALRVAEERYQKHIDAGGTEFYIQGDFPDKPLAH